VQNLLSIYPILFIKGRWVFKLPPYWENGWHFCGLLGKGDLVRDKIFIAQ